MKGYQFIISLVIFPLVLKAQYHTFAFQDPLTINAQKVNEGKICDTCLADVIFPYSSPFTPLYAIIDALDEYRMDSSLYKRYGNSLPKVSKHFIASGEFSIDFIANSLQILPIGSNSSDNNFEVEPYIETSRQFLILHNNQVIGDWSDITSLQEDKDYNIGYNYAVDPLKEKFKKWKNYHAGRFKLSLNDSLIVFVRDSLTKDTVGSIFIKRIPIIPQYFDFIKFSSDRDLQDILNNETFGAGIAGETTDNFTMDASQVALLRFHDFRVQRNELEYAFADKPGDWHTLTGLHDHPSQYFYILINNPAPGKTIELMLRYKMQRETVHRISIKVKEKSPSNIWLKVAVAIAILSLLFAFWGMYKRIKHAKEMRQLTLNKEETESKLQLLSGQLNPHFLFNSLNSVQNLINKQDTEQASLYVSEVSSFLRTIMDAGKKEYISLEEELKMEVSYMKLEQKRTSFEYTVINECSNDLSEVEFPPSLLQPVIENSIHHGFTKDIQAPLITIKISCLKKQLVVAVIDNGQGFKPDLIKPGHGLAIVQNRISLINKKLNAMPVEMQVQSSSAGTVTTFTFQNWL